MLTYATSAKTFFPNKVIFTGFKYISLFWVGAQFDPLHWPIIEWLLVGLRMNLYASLKKGMSTMGDYHLSSGLPVVTTVRYQEFITGKRLRMNFCFPKAPSGFQLEEQLTVNRNFLILALFRNFGHEKMSKNNCICVHGFFIKEPCVRQIWVPPLTGYTTISMLHKEPRFPIPNMIKVILI